MPIESPPTPAPSPGPTSRQLPSIASISRQEFSILPPAQRRQYLCAILNDCTPDELSFVSNTIAPLLKRDFLRDLPPEIALYILSYFNEPSTLLRAGRVSRYWHSLVADDFLWKRLRYIHGFVPGQGVKYPDYSSDERVPSNGRTSPSRTYPTPSLRYRSHRMHFEAAFVTRTFLTSNSSCADSLNCPLLDSDQLAARWHALTPYPPCSSVPSTQ